MPAGYPDTHYARQLGAAAPRSSLGGVIETETCVVGGGLAGVATALDLAERGREVVLLEAHRIGWGASGRNGGFVSDGFQRDVDALERRVGPHRAREMHALTRAAMDLLRARLDRHGIACGPRPPGVMRVAFRGQRAGLEAWRDRVERDYGAQWTHWPASRVRAALATDRYADALVTDEGFAVDPLAMTRGLASAAEALGARLFENARVRSIRRVGGRLRVAVRGGEVRCDHVVVASGAYGGALLPRLWAAMAPAATFVMTTKPLGERLTGAIAVPYAIHDMKFATNYYRVLPDGALLWGGRVLSWQPSPAAIARALRRDMEAMYPGLCGVPVRVAWSGLMPFLRHRMPVVAHISPGVWVATGFGGHGLALTTMAGRLIGAAIGEGDDRWRLFAALGLPFAAGPASRVPAQAVFWGEAARHRLHVSRGFSSADTAGTSRSS